MLDLKKLFPNSKFQTAEELKAKEGSFFIGDRVKVADNIRCIQNGQTGTIVQIEPEDKHGWKSFIVKFDDEKYGAMGFQSGNIDKLDERENTMKKIDENQKVTLTIGQLKKLVKESGNDYHFNDIMLMLSSISEVSAKAQAIIKGSYPDVSDADVEELKDNAESLRKMSNYLSELLGN